MRTVKLKRRMHNCAVWSATTSSAYTNSLQGIIVVLANSTVPWRLIWDYAERPFSRDRAKHAQMDDQQVWVCNYESLITRSACHHRIHANNCQFCLHNGISLTLTESICAQSDQKLRRPLIGQDFTLWYILHLIGRTQGSTDKLIRSYMV